MRLLHLEDSATDAMLSASVITREWPACQIEHVANAVEYRKALDGGGFDLILSDFSLPDFDGLSALAMARVRYPATPFLFLSGTIGEERAVEALKHGATDYIIKDRPARLVPAIRQAFASIAESDRRRRAEAALRAYEGPFRQITENVDELVALVDLNAARVYANAAYEDLLGEAAVLPGVDAFAEVHPEDLRRARAAFAQVLKAGATQRFEYRLLLRDGSTRNIETHASILRDATGKIVNVLLVSRDLTASREAEAREREQASLLDRARNPIIATDIDHRVAFWNASAERLYGWKAAEVLGRRLDRLELAFDLPRFAEARAELLSTGEWHGDFRLRTKSGDTVLVQSTWSLIGGSDDRPHSILHIDTDVTARTTWQMQSQRTQRTESIATLASGVAHDLNNVLTPILLSLDQLAGKVTGEEDRQLLERAKASATQGAAVVQQLLAFGGAADGKQVKVDPSASLALLRPLIRQSLPPTVHFSIGGAGQTWPIRADAAQFNEMVIQLCLNARDAMPEGGRIEVGAENVTVDSARSRGNPGTRPGPFVRVSVADIGTGMPPAVVEKIFDPFFTTKPIGQGTGLGLSMVAGIMKSHSGFVQVTSEPGRGSRFDLFFPAFIESTLPPSDKSPASPNGDGDGVLVVEDQSAVRDALRVLLQRAGYRVFSAEDGASGLAEFDRRRAEISVVLVDMMLPDQLGTQLIASMRERSPALPIVAMSGLMASGKFDELMEVKPAVERLAKPFSPATLLSAVGRALTGAKQTAGSGLAAPTLAEA